MGRFIMCLTFNYLDNGMLFENKKNDEDAYYFIIFNILKSILKKNC
jgi:hypothetical protein